MVNFINGLITKFNKLILDFFLKAYNLKVRNLKTRNLTAYNLRSVEQNRNINKKTNEVIVYKNSFVINNRILNLQYNCNLDETKDSVVYILYRNISYTDINRNELKCYLDFETKNKIHNSYKKFQNICSEMELSRDVIIIGRKYIHKNKIDKNINTLGTLCKYKIENDMYKKNIKVNKIYKNYENKKFNIRRRFLFNLKSELQDDIPLSYTNNILKNSLFLDVEYINDIYDDFKTFPISKDSTLLFMIGYSFINNTKSVEYKNFIVNKLDTSNEYQLLNNFLNNIIEKYNKTKTPIIIFHWSNADKLIIEKSLKRHPDLYTKYKNEVVIKYVDLLLIVKKTIFLFKIFRNIISRAKKSYNLIIILFFIIE
jgi:hypothetical protein